MINKPTITIGIPAFNEEGNIAFLLDDLIRQKQVNYILKKIIVYSDASTDKTVQIIKDRRDRRIEVIDGKKRMGVGGGSNILMQRANTDIFVLLNADIAIKDKLFIQKLINPIRFKKADLTSGSLQPLPAENFFEKILYVSMKYKRLVFESYRNGQNLFTCYGPMRAFSKRLYKKIVFKKSVADDMYSYLFALYNGYQYSYVRQAVSYFKLPTKFGDFRKQSIRYWSSASLFSEFGEQFVNSHYFLPKKLFVSKGLEIFLRYPLYAPLYPVLPLYTRIESFFKKNLAQNTWAIATSSKTIRRPS